MSQLLLLHLIQYLLFFSTMLVNISDFFPESELLLVQSLSVSKSFSPRGLYHARLLWSLLKYMSIESVMPSNHIIRCYPHLPLPWIFPSIRVFSSESALQSGGQNFGTLASASVLPMNIQGWFPLGFACFFSLLSRLSRVFCNITVWKPPFFGA